MTFNEWWDSTGAKLGYGDSKELVEKAWNSGFDEGREAGYEDGIDCGYSVGYEDGHANED